MGVSKRRKLRWMMILFRMENVLIHAHLQGAQSILIREARKRKFYPELVNEAIKKIEESDRYLPSSKEVKIFCEVMDLQSLAGNDW